MNFPTPTVGRQVYFFTGDNEESEIVEPMAATVIKVHGKPWQRSAFSLVNLLAIDPDNGETTFHESVPHSPIPVNYPHFRWMQYQLEMHNRGQSDNQLNNC